MVSSFGLLIPALAAAAARHGGTAAADAFVVRPPLALPPSVSTASASTAASASAFPRPSVGLLRMTSEESDTEMESSEVGPPCWNPQLRREIASLASLGAAETAWLAYDKIWGDGVAASAICGADSADIASGCGSVLDGPYSVLTLGGMTVPLSAVGFAAYASVFALALWPLLFGSDRSGGDAVEEGSTEDDELDATNRLAIAALATVMATFSSYLMGLLFGVIHASCPFCFVSAALSFALGGIAWFGGVIPSNKAAGEGAVQLGLGGFLASTAAALALFLSVDNGTARNDILAANGFTASVVANAATRQQQKDLPPPPITTHSTERTLKIASDLESLNARMFGAYWCSHCYEQKERLGLEAMRRIPYVECSKEGLNSQRDLCQERDVPGYPTWEVGGKLYPGEMELDELEGMVKESRERLAKSASASSSSSSS